MTRADATRFRRACQKMSAQLGTPGFEGALLQFYVALAALKKSENDRAH